MARREGEELRAVSPTPQPHPAGRRHPQEPRQWRTDDDRRDAEAAEAERLRDEGKLIEHGARPEPSSKNKD